VPKPHRSHLAWFSSAWDRPTPFLRDFAEDGADAAFRALLAGRTRHVDLIRLTHSDGAIYSLIFLASVSPRTLARSPIAISSALGALGYLLGVFVRVAQLRRRKFTLRCDEDY